MTDNVAESAPAVDENTLDLHLDISLPEIVLESPSKPSGDKQRMLSVSPDGDNKASQLLMSDERELLKDL